MSTIAADASTSTIAWIEETAWGTTPTTPVFQSMRQTGNGLAPTLNKVTSDEIASNPAVTDVITTQGGAEGDINFEPSYGESMDMMFEQTLRSVFDGFGIIKGSDSYKSVTFERIINKDGTPNYFRYAGSRANSLALTFDATATSPITGTFNIMAKSESDSTSLIAGATYTKANSNPVMSMPELRAVSVSIGGVTKTACFTSLSPTFNNNIRSQQGKCTDTSTYPDITAKGIGYGRREVTLDIGYYFNDLDFVDMFQANTEGSLSYILSDGARGYKITYPRFKILESSIPIEGNDSDVIQTMTIQALYDSTEATDVKIEKIGALSGGYKLTGTVTPSDVVGNYYSNGTTKENSEFVLYSVNGKYAIWYDGTDTLLTTLADVGSGTPGKLFNVLGSYDPDGTWAAVSGTGTLTSVAYDPTA
jgi:hypothetical protein